jgi:hypothetical protein
MQVHVAREPGAGDLTLVDAEVEAVGSVGFADGAQRPPGEGHELEQLDVLEVFDRRGVAVRRDHQVAAVVRKRVQHHQTALPAVEHQPGLIVAGLGGQAEDAALVLAFTLDVAHAPWRPQALVRHRTSIAPRPAPVKSPSSRLDPPAGRPLRRMRRGRRQTVVDLGGRQA